MLTSSWSKLVNQKTTPHSKVKIRNGWYHGHLILITGVIRLHTHTSTVSLQLHTELSAEMRSLVKFAIFLVICSFIQVKSSFVDVPLLENGGKSLILFTKLKNSIWLTNILKIHSKLVECWWAPQRWLGWNWWAFNCYWHNFGLELESVESLPLIEATHN